MSTTFVQLKKHGQRTVAVTTQFELSPQYDMPFLKALGRAYYWQNMIDCGQAHSGSDIARQKKLQQATVNKILRLTRLCPDIVKMLMEGRQPRNMTLQWFIRNNFPVNWEKQHQLVAEYQR